MNENSKAFKQDPYQEGLEKGINMQKAFMLAVVKRWCDKPAESAAITPGDARQGQIKNADALFEYLKEYMK